jgi:hypothetical protein
LIVIVSSSQKDSISQAYVVPTVVMIITQILIETTRKCSANVIDHPKSTYTEHRFMPHLAMIESIGITLFLTFILKVNKTLSKLKFRISWGDCAQIFSPCAITKDTEMLLQRTILPLTTI